MANKLTQPKIDHYCEWLGRPAYFSYDREFNYTEETLALADELFSLLKQIAPTSDNGCRTLWFRAQRGPIEDWRDPEKEVRHGEYEDEDEVRKEWLSWFPNETEWYEFSALEDNGYRIISVGHKCVFFFKETRGNSRLFNIRDESGLKLYVPFNLS